jgi:hypothetical protein
MDRMSRQVQVQALPLLALALLWCSRVLPCLEEGRVKH